MKRFIYNLPAVAFMLLCSCTEAETSFGVEPPVTGGNTEEGVPLSVKSLGLSVEVETRSIVTGAPPVAMPGNPNPLQTVGLFVTQDKNGVMYTYDGNYRQVFKYNAAAVPAAAWEPDLDFYPILYLFSEKGTVYAFSPSDKSVSLTTVNGAKAPYMGGIAVKDKQSFIFSDGGTGAPGNVATDVQWELDGQEDYLYGRGTTIVDRWNPQVSLTMHHALAKVSFRIIEANSGGALSDTYVASVVLKGTGAFKKSTGAKLNLETGELSGTLTPVDQLTFVSSGDLRKVATNVADKAQAPIQAFGLAIPVTATGVTLEFTDDSKRVFTMKPNADGSPSTFDIQWERGKNYIYNIEIQPQGIVITDLQVEDWIAGNGAGEDIPVE